MNRINSIKCISFMTLLFSAILFIANAVCAQEENTSVATGTNFSADSPGTSTEKAKGVSAKDIIASEEIKELEKKTRETTGVLKGKEEDAEAARKEAEIILKEKEEIEKEVKVKEAAADLTKEKLDAVKKEASSTKSPEARKEVQELAKEAEKLEKEAIAKREELKVKELRSEEAQKELKAHQATLDALKKELQDLKMQRNAKRGFLEKALFSVGIIFIGLFFFLIMKIAIRQFEQLLTKKDAIRENEMILRIKTLSKLFNWLGTIVIICVIMYMVLENHGVNVAPLLAGAGIIGLAFGFGGQYLIRDLINGLFILVEGQFRINDVVKIDEYGGLVEDINLRITTLRDLEGRVIIIPNGEIKTVVNFTREYAQALLDIGVAYKENVDRVMSVIKEIGSGMRKDPYFGKLIIGDLEMLGVDDFADSQVTIKFRMKTLPIKQWEVMRECRRRIKNRFDELGIEIPFPHRTIYWGTGKDNEWVKAFADRFQDGEKR
ncbi:MAG: mechanosensitive ion channel domain-containing protein [Candidatus Omnitrophota bacterium]